MKSLQQMKATIDSLISAELPTETLEKLREIKSQVETAEQEADEINKDLLDTKNAYIKAIRGESTEDKPEENKEPRTLEDIAKSIVKGE